jgi:hypothetical protein
MQLNNLTSIENPTSSGISALNRLKLLKQPAQTPKTVSQTVATAEDLAVLEKSMGAQSVEYPQEGEVLSFEATAFEPPAFIPEVVSQGPGQSAFSDIKPLTPPSQPATAETILQPVHLNESVRNQPLIQPVQPTIPQPQMAPRAEVAAPVISNTPIASQPTSPTLEIVETVKTKTSVKGFINKILPFTRKDQNAILVTTLESTKNGSARNADLMEGELLVHLQEKKGDR